MELISYIWNGKLPLWKVYWLFGVLGGIVFRFADMILSGPQSDGTISLGFSSLFALLYIIYFTIVLVGVWRSATNYTGHVVWPILAKFVTIIAFGKVMMFTVTALGLNQ